MNKKMVKEVVKFLKYSLIGNIAFALTLLITVFLTEMLNLQYYISYAIALVLGGLLCFFCQMRFTFKVSGEVPKRLLKYAITGAARSLVRWLLVLAFVELMGIYYVVTIVIVTLLTAVVAFIVQKLWVFKESPAGKK
jgi:putative flippase GtrA